MKENLLIDPWFASSFTYGTNILGFLLYPLKEIESISEIMYGFNKLTLWIKPKIIVFSNSCSEHTSALLKHNTCSVPSYLYKKNMSLNMATILDIANRKIFLNTMTWTLDLFLSSQA